MVVIDFATKRGRKCVTMLIKNIQSCVRKGGRGAESNLRIGTCVAGHILKPRSGCNGTSTSSMRWYSSKIEQKDEPAIIKTVDAKVVNNFAKHNGEMARRALQTPFPPFKNNDHDHGFQYNYFTRSRNCSLALEDYLKWRGWDAECLNHEMTNALISHAITFPLTLASSAHHFLPPDESGDKTKTQSTSKLKEQNRNVRICCVGSRAEANLPDEYWREFLIATNAFHGDEVNTNRNMNTNSNTSINWTIDCIGPEISRQMKSRCIDLDLDSDYCDSDIDIIASRTNAESGLQRGEGECARTSAGIFHKSLTINYHCGYLHNYVMDLYKSKSKEKAQTQKQIQKQDDEYIGVNADVDVKDILNMWDGFILFNPGIGHPHLQKSWRPTMEFIIKTKRKVVMTAHSELDGERDAKLLEDLMAAAEAEADADDFESTPSSIHKYRHRPNPFCSRMSFLDPYAEKGSEHVHVRPNHSILLL